MIKKPNSNLYEKTNYKDIREAIKDGIKKYSDCIAFTLKNKEGKEVTYRDITYKELGEEIDALGTGFLNLGLKNKRIAIIGQNSYPWFLSYLSVLFGVGVVVPLDKGLPPQEIEDSIVRSGAECIIFEDKYYEDIKNIRANEKTLLKQYICMQKIDDASVHCIDDIMAIGKQELEKGNMEFIDATIDPEAASILLFTSGTTSLSRGPVSGGPPCSTKRSMIFRWRVLR